ncbi:hypothetical protein CHS0354_003266, partial [Potamilus streckersoni]
MMIFATQRAIRCHRGIDGKTIDLTCNRLNDSLVANIVMGSCLFHFSFDTHPMPSFTDMRFSPKSVPVFFECSIRDTKPKKPENMTTRKYPSTIVLLNFTSRVISASSRLRSAARNHH